MPDATISIATGFNGGVTVGISADSYGEALVLSRDLFGEDGEDVLEGLLNHLKAQSILGSKAVENATVVSLGGTVEPAQQQQARPAAAAGTATQQSAPAAGGPPPGQNHDPQDPTKTKWVPAGTSKKPPYKSYPGFWAKP